jgi:hypothetical protein
MAQPTLETVTTNAGAGGETFLVETVGSDLAPVSLLCYSTGDGTVEVVTDSGTEGLPVRIEGAALTALQLIDDPVFADDAAFTLGSSKAMVSGAIRDDTLSTLTAVEGDVVPLRVSSTGALHVTGGGGGTEYTEDAAAAADPVGTALILVREDARAGSLTSTDGDNVALRGNNLGEAYVIDTDAVALLTTIDTDTGSIATTNALIAVDTAVIAGDTTSIDGKITACDTGAVVIASGTITTVSTITNVAQLGGAAVPIGAGVEATAIRVTLPTDGTGIVGLAAGTNGIGKLTANSGVDIGDVDVTSVVPGTAATNLGKAEDAVHTSGDVGVMALAVRTDTPINRSGTDGDYEPLQISDGRLWVVPDGRVAHDAVDAGNPVKIGGIARDEDAASVANADRVNGYFDTQGRLIVAKAPKEELLDGTASATDTSDTAVIAAQGAGFRVYVTALIISNESSTNAAVLIKSATTTRLRVPAPANSGAVINFDPPVRLGDNEAFNFASSASVTTMHVSAVGFKGR